MRPAAPSPNRLAESAGRKGRQPWPAALWARRILPAKNSLSAADARQLWPSKTELHSDDRRASPYQPKYTVRAGGIASAAASVHLITVAHVLLYATKEANIRGRAGSAGPRLPASTAPADFRPNDQSRRNATALPPHVTMSHTTLHRHSSVGK
jgi:hypothetical protein